MASINASTSGAGGVITTADNTGNLNIQSAGSTVLALTSSGVAITGTLTQSGNSVLTSASTLTTIQVQTATAGSSEGDLGTYAFLYQPSGGYTQGATVAGSSLNWISLYASSLGGATAFTNTVNATTLSGTWKAMNKGNYSGSGAIGVWLRVA
jgi:hypothetical protein